MARCRRTNKLFIFVRDMAAVRFTERKGEFIKEHMSRSENFAGGSIVASVSFVVWRVSKENTRV
jgi:hypothetical protein